MKILHKILLLSLAVFAVQHVVAQTVLTGVVKDATYGDPLTGANVYVMNSENRSLNGCIVDLNGNYRLQIPDQKNLTIVFSFVGFKSKSVKYTGQKSINETLEEERLTLNAVDVTAKKVEKNALGQTQRELVSATQKITMEKLETGLVTNVTEALQGALANVDILTGADPGSGSTIRIRGTASLNANADPLFVLDGVPLPVTISSDFSFATANSEDYGQLLNISPSDIESIEVLKDAAATAVWGSKGANGVLLITTKKGKKGRLSFSYSTKFEYKKEGSSIPMLNSKQYVSMIQDAIWNSVNDIGQGDSEANNLLALLYDTKEIGVFPDWVYYDEYNQDVNWQNLVTQPGYSLDNNFSLSGGGDKANYRLSLGYLEEDGTTIGTAYRRFSTTFNMNYKFSDKLDIFTNYNFTRGVKDANYSSDDMDGNARSQALSKMPNMSPYTIGEDGKMTNEYFTPYSYFQGTYADDGVYNPVALVYESKNQTKAVSSRMVFNVHYKFFRGLDYFGIVGFDARTNKTNQYLPQSVTGESYISKYVNVSTDAGSDNLYLTTENRLIYSKNFGEIHKLLFSGIWQTSDQTNSSYSSTTTGNASIEITDPVVGSNTKNSAGSSGRVVSRNMGGVFNSQYTLMEKYMFNASYRMEASSSLSNKSRWRGFPTVGFAWQFGDENFIKNLNVISMGKIRVNWGQSGNAPSGSAPYIGTFSAISNGYGEMAAIQPTKIQLDNLDYEIINQSNIGLDMAFFDNRLNITVDLYDKLTTNMLQKDVKLPTSTGFTEVKYYNSGSMSNKGWEFRADYDFVRNKIWKVSANFNISKNINKILDLPDNKKDVYYTFGNKNYAYKFVEGDPLGSFYGYRYQGVYQNVEDTYAQDLKGNIIYDIDGEPVVMKNGSSKVYPGDAKYQDMNGDGVIDKYDIVYIGNSNPLLIGGFGFNISYKNWGLVANFHGRIGQKVINQVRMNNEYMYGKDNQSVAVLRRWRQEGDDTDIPRALYNRGYNNLGSDRYVEDASFLRMKTLTLKYDFPKSLINKFKIQRLQVYLTGYDMLTFTKYTGQDPEINLSWVNSIYPVYVDKASTPKPLRMAFGLNLGL
ncbi:MAG: SusC/RagA family TonB-linked outer membrane protein [Paludibacter sp.]|nr:SusC/RagA family TonB-linked outer membrane protein [Paludibacter sp.]